MRKIGWVIGAVAVAAVGAYALTAGGDERPRPRAGECAHIEGSADAPSYRATDCADDQANVKIAKVVEGDTACPGGGAKYSRYTASATLCLMPNFVEGACYQSDRGSGLRKVDCKTAESVKVVKVAHGAPTTCEPDRAVAYPEPAVTFCLAKSTG